LTRLFLGMTLRGLLIAAISIAVLLAFATMWLFGWGFFSRETADFRGQTDQVEQISADADYRIATYEQFFDLCAAVQTKEAELAAAQAELALEGLSDYRRQQLNANVTAITAARAELINQYNADAAKADTAANFRSSDLPYSLDIESETTTCAASE
jgi:predicted Zn-dependent peptidase